jgi:hypothetical protein
LIWPIKETVTGGDDDHQVDRNATPNGVAVKLVRIGLRFVSHRIGIFPMLRTKWVTFLSLGNLKRFSHTRGVSPLQPNPEIYQHRRRSRRSGPPDPITPPRAGRGNNHSGYRLRKACLKLNTSRYLLAGSDRLSRGQSFYNSGRFFLNAI